MEKIESIEEANKFLKNLRENELKEDFDVAIGGKEYGWNSSNLFLREAIQKAIIKAYKLGKQSLSKNKPFQPTSKVLL